MAGDDAANVGQPDAGALKLLRAVETLENAEKFLRILHFETHAIIANEDHKLPFLVKASDLDFRRIFRAGVLHRVREQIDEHLSQHGMITQHGWQALYLPPYRPVLRFLSLQRLH